MRKFKLLGISVLLFTSTACAPTWATKTITETTGPDGKKTISVTKTLTQQIQLIQTSSTDDVINTVK